MSKLEDRILKNFRENIAISNLEEDFMVDNRNIRATKVFVLVAAIIGIFGATAFAAYQYLNAKEAVNMMGDRKLASCFEDSTVETETRVDGNYKATILGVTSGENISDFQSSIWDLIPERTYAVITVEKADGSDMTYDDSILVTPFIEGLAPWQYNIYTMHGSYQEKIVDGILYRIVEFDNIEYFADKQVYIAVLDEAYMKTEAFVFDEKTGRISESKDYEGTNILFELALDKAKADPQKAAQYLEIIQNERIINDTGKDESSLSLDLIEEA